MYMIYNKAHTYNYTCTHYIYVCVYKQVMGMVTSTMMIIIIIQHQQNVCHQNVCHFHGGRWGCEVSCAGHHRLRGKT